MKAGLPFSILIADDDEDDCMILALAGGMVIRFTTQGTGNLCLATDTVSCLDISFF